MAQAFYNSWITRFGTPFQIEIEQGKQFQFNCLDHINLKTDNKAQIFIIKTYITDHFPVLLNLVCTKKRKKDVMFKKVINLDNTARDFNASNAQSVIDIPDPNIATETLINIIKQLLDENTTIRKIPNRKYILKPWISKGLQKCITHRDALHIKTKAAPTNEILATSYRRYCNYCNDLIKKVKKEYESSEIDKCKNPKDRWKTLRKFTNTADIKNPAEELLKHNRNNPLSRPNQINELLSS